MITKVLKIIGIISNFFDRSSKNDRLKEDKELADAIKRGDSETVSKIRERRKHYSNLGILIFTLIFSTSCACFKSHYKDVPLTSGAVAYQIPAGIYKDTKGNIYNEQYPRWSLSEEDLFNKTRDIKPEKDKTFNFINHVKEYGLSYLVLICALIFLKRLK